MKSTIRKCVLVGAALLAGVGVVAAACWNNSMQQCPATVHGAGGICTLAYGGQQYPFVINAPPGMSGETTAIYDNTPHCDYNCPSGPMGYYTGSTMGTNNYCFGS